MKLGVQVTLAVATLC